MLAFRYCNTALILDTQKKNISQFHFDTFYRLLCGVDEDGSVFELDPSVSRLRLNIHFVGRENEIASYPWRKKITGLN